MEAGNITSPEGILILPLALFFDGAAIAIFVVEVWFDLGIISTLISWTGWLLIGGWAYFRGSMSLTDYATSLYEKSKKGSTKKSPENIAGSGDMKDWQQGKDGVYELKSAETTETEQVTEPSPGLIGKATGAVKGFIKRVGWSYIVELIPWIGAIWPGLTIFVWRELQRETGSSMPEDEQTDDSGAVSNEEIKKAAGQADTTKATKTEIKTPKKPGITADKK